MSRPIVEPSTPLDLGKKGFSINQLQRRPVYPDQTAELGLPTTVIYMPLIGNGPNVDNDPMVGPAMSFELDATAPFGGYVTRSTPAIDSYFTFMVNMQPQGSIWGLSWVYGIGPDYGIVETSVASVIYQSPERQSGCPIGKIQPPNEAYGGPLNYMAFSTQDAYNATDDYAFIDGMQVWVIGGDVGSPLTDFADTSNPCATGGGDDPFTGYTIWDGGPGWYRFRFQVTDKNASSTNYRHRINHIGLIRLDDSGYL